MKYSLFAQQFQTGLSYIRQLYFVNRSQSLDKFVEILYHNTVRVVDVAISHVLTECRLADLAQGFTTFNGLSAFSPSVGFLVSRHTVCTCISQFPSLGTNESGVSARNLRIVGIKSMLSEPSEHGTAESPNEPNKSLTGVGSVQVAEQ
jgi:hypothetical protein